MQTYSPNEYQELSKLQVEENVYLDILLRKNVKFLLFCT